MEFKNGIILTFVYDLYYVGIMADPVAESCGGSQVCHQCLCSKAAPSGVYTASGWHCSFRALITGACYFIVTH